MNTPKQILDDAHWPITYDDKGTIIEVMKEYARQWIDRASEVGNRHEYITDKEWILRLKKEIDKQ